MGCCSYNNSNKRMLKKENQNNKITKIDNNTILNEKKNYVIDLTSNESNKKENIYEEINNEHKINDSNIEKNEEESILNIKYSDSKLEKTNSHQINKTESNTNNLILNNQRNINGFYDKTFYSGKDPENIIGKGGIGLVVKESINYKDENGNYKIVACKYIAAKDLDKIKRKNFLMNFFREAGLMVGLMYKNIVKLISINSASSKLIMEYMEGGNLTNVIYNNKNISLYFKIYCLFQICDGLKFLHDKQIIHGDLKSLNILLDTKYIGDDKDFPTLKLSDFGISGIKEDICPGETPGFAAPELYYGEKKRTIKSDIYSFGVVIYEIFKGESPNINRKIEKNKFYPLPDISKENWPIEIKNIILECCNEKNELRPNIEKIKNEISEYCINSKNEELIKIRNKAIKEVNFNVVNINDFACKLFEEIKSVSTKKIGEYIHIVNNIPLTGFGEYNFEDGTKYVGLFENGNINKYGKIIYSNGITYQGQHFKGVWNGIGIFKYKNGVIEYKGYFKNFAFNEYGIISTIQMNKGKIIGKHEFNGEFKEGIQNGIGIYTDPENRKYLGEWKNGNFEGIGTFKYPDGEICQGEFKAGIRQGFCYINYIDGSYFEGHCDKGRFNGYGKFIIKPGQTYEGKWENGCPLEDDKLIIE